MDANSANANTRALVGSRIAVGVLFLIFAQYKVFGTQFTLGGGFQYLDRLLPQRGRLPGYGAVWRNPRSRYRQPALRVRGRNFNPHGASNRRSAPIATGASDAAAMPVRSHGAASRRGTRRLLHPA